MRIAFSSPTLAGHLYPMITLAQKVQERGHEVFFLCLADAEPLVRAAGLEFVPFALEEFPAGEMDRRARILSKLGATEALEYTVNMLADNSRAALRDGERAIRASRPDAIVLDTVARGLNLVAMHLEIPFVHVSNAMHFDFSGHTPLCLFDWPYLAGPAGVVRNGHGNAMFAMMLASLAYIQGDYAESVGLKIDREDPSAGISQLARLTQTPKEFDFPSDHWPANFYHTGPWHDLSLRPAIDFPWDKLTGEPIVYASMGTLQNGSEQIFKTIAEAAEAPGRQLVLSIGQHLDADEIGPLAANTIVVKHAPQIALLQRASLCITHAGLNTVLESLACGVPMVAIPITNDQPGVGARIGYTRTGLVVPMKQLSAEKLRTAVDSVLTEPSYRENAERLQQAIARTKGLEMAADIIDRTLRAAVDEPA